jgi:histidine triad (HIT) family protein
MECKRVGIAVIGLEVPHAHIHLVPINEVGDINFSNKRVELLKEEFQAIAKKINTRFSA